MRRRAPRPLSASVGEAARRAAPASVLAQVQGCWGAVAGPAIAAEATPVAEHGGTLTVSCRSAVWAAELELLAPDLLSDLNAALPGPPGTPLEGPAGAIRRRPLTARPRRRRTTFVTVGNQPHTQGPFLLRFAGIFVSAEPLAGRPTC